MKGTKVIESSITYFHSKLVDINLHDRKFGEKFFQNPKFPVHG